MVKSHSLHKECKILKNSILTSRIYSCIRQPHCRAPRKGDKRGGGKVTSRIHSSYRFSGNESRPRHGIPFPKVD